MFAKIEAKIAKHQFLSRKEFSALATMLAKIRSAMIRTGDRSLVDIEDRYTLLLSVARCADRSFKLDAKIERIVFADVGCNAQGFYLGAW